MSRIVVMHAKPGEADGPSERLRSAGHDVQVLWPDGMPGLAALRRDPPDVFVIDLARQPSQGQALGTALRQLKATRHVPLVFVDGDPKKTARVKTALPDATYATWRGIRGAVKQASNGDEDVVSAGKIDRAQDVGHSRVQDQGKTERRGEVPSSSDRKSRPTGPRGLSQRSLLSQQENREGARQSHPVLRKRRRKGSGLRSGHSSRIRQEPHLSPG